MIVIVIPYMDLQLVRNKFMETIVNRPETWKANYTNRFWISANRYSYYVMNYTNW